MRLKEYINEAVETKEVNELIQPKIKPFYDFLKKQNWIVDDKDIVDFLNKLFKGESIGYKFKIVPGKGKIYRNISGGLLSIKGGQVVLDINIVEGVSNFFKRFAKSNKDKMFLDIRKNQFFSDLLNMLSHEFRHIGQLISSKFAITFIDPEVSSAYEYFGSSAEIDAFSLQAAIEFLKYKKHGSVYKMYRKIFSSDDDNYKRFLKKLEKYKKELKQLNLKEIF